MSKADQNKVKKETEDQRGRIQQQGDVAGGRVSEAADVSEGRASSLFPGASEGFADITKTGGYDPAILGRLQEGYGKLAETGGIDEAGATAMRNRSAQGVKGVYDTLSDQARRTSSATGGFGGNIGSTISQLARQSGNAQATAITGVDASIAGLRQAGTVAGLGGGAGLESSVAAGRRAGVSGTAGLYGQESTNTSAALGQILENLRTTGSLTNQDLAILEQISQRPCAFGNILAGIKTIGGAGAGVISAIKPGGFN